MRWHSLTSQDWARAVGVGIGVAVLTAAVMVTALKSGVSPLPKPLGLAFAETVLGRPLPLPVGLIFHTVWVTAFSVIYVGLFRGRADVSARARACHRTLDSRAHILLSCGWLGLFRAGYHAKTDRRIGSPPPAICNHFVGTLQACIQEQ